MKLENNVRSGGTVNVASANEQDVGGFGHDYRRLEERSEGFLQFYAASVATGDCDPALWLMRYLNERYEYSIEERLWFAWLYHTYNLPTAFVYKNEFPDEELASVERFTQWNNENYARLRYQTDTKWSKGHLPAMYQSYCEWVHGSSQSEKFASICVASPEENFDRLWNVVKGSWYKFGRYTAFFYLQTLKHTCGVNIDCPSLMLSDYDGSKSHRNGLCFALGKDQWVNERLTVAEYQWLEDAGAELLLEARKRWPLLAVNFDNFSMETALCAYKKLWRVKRGRYVGYYLDRQSEEVMKAESDDWYGIDWNVIWQAREEIVGERLAPRYAREDKAKMSLFLDAGTLHYYYSPK
jgi:hypothetical protein